MKERRDTVPFVLTVRVTDLLVVFILCAALMGDARHELATTIAEGRATVEKHTFADGSTEVRIIWKETPK